MKKHGVIEEVAAMIRTGASEKTVFDYIEKLYQKEEITDRVYSLLNSMAVEAY